MATETFKMLVVSNDTVQTRIDGKNAQRYSESYTVDHAAIQRVIWQLEIPAIDWIDFRTTTNNRVIIRKDSILGIEFRPIVTESQEIIEGMEE